MRPFLKPGEKQDRLFSDEALDLIWTDGLRLNVNGTIAELNTRSFSLQNTRVNWESGEGGINAYLKGRSRKDESVNVALEVVPVSQGYKVDTSIKGLNVSMGAFNHSTRWNRNENSEFSVDIALTGQGESVRDIMSSSNE